MRVLGNILLIGVIAYIGFGLLLYLKQRQFMYFPTPEVVHKFKEEIFSNEGESIKVVVLNNENKKAIMYFGGNGEAVERSAAHLIDTFPGHAVYLIKYRGYGGSSGSPEERGIYSDALYIFDQLVSRHENISVIGRSLGSGVATLLAAERDIDKLVLVTPFDSAENVAKKHYPLYPISLLLKDKYDSLSRAGSITVPTLMIIAENDRVIEQEHSFHLAEKLTATQVAVELFKNTGHNSIDDQPQYYALLTQFFRN